MHDIFISYAREDGSRAEKLAGALEALGWSVFWDRRIPAGQTWRTHVGAALDEARCVVVAWSASSIESHWVLEEAEEARQRNVLIPLLLDDVAPPIGFRSVQAADLAHWEGATSDPSLEQLVTDIEALIGPPPEAAAEAERSSAAEPDPQASATETALSGPRAETRTERLRGWLATIDRRTRWRLASGVAVAFAAIAVWQFWPPSAAAPEARIVDFSATATAITEGDEVTLTWSTADADSVHLLPGGSVAASGSTAVTPPEDTESRLRAYGPGEPAERSLRVSVTAAPVETARSPPVEARRPAAPPPAPAAARRPALPAGADDPLNRPVWIEGGTFSMGSDEGSPHERPVRRVTVSGFWMQEHEVTNEEYRRFDPAHEFPTGSEKHPVVNVSWHEAQAYAASRGGSLPTEAQWEFAARGTAGRRYPWGDQAPTCQRAHYSACEPEATIPVMSRPEGATPEGIHDLAGNVWEWVADWYGDYDPADTRDPRGPASGRLRVLRGASFFLPAHRLQAAGRINSDPDYGGINIGFRVVWAPTFES